MKSLKSKKMGSLFSREISMIVLNEVKDPIVKEANITGTDVTNDLSFAKVYVTVLNRENKEKVLESLNKASSFIEMSLSKKIDIRKMPKISFHYDTSIEYGEEIEKKIEELKENN